MPKHPTSTPPRRVLVVTGSRSEFGLLRPVMTAVKKQNGLTLQVAVAGEHLLGPAFTWREVAKAFRIHAKVPMQTSGDKDRAAHAAACGRGVEGFAKAIRKLKPDWVVVLGDRIEAFAAASAASIAGVAVCHVHGGDRAEGIADEAMRHAITKLAHLHCAATKLSAERIVKMGEPEQLVHVTGSPAIDGLAAVRSMSDKDAQTFGDPLAVVLLHPSGLAAQDEGAIALAICDALSSCMVPSLLLAPNHDPGSGVIRRVLERALASGNLRYPTKERDPKKRAALPNLFHFAAHLERPVFLSLLKRLSLKKEPPAGGMMIGNSSAGIIEAAALGLAAINVGPRQDGRERGANVLDVPYRREPTWGVGAVEAAVLRATHRPFGAGKHPYGDGSAGPRIAALLAKTDPHDPAILRKRIAY